ncbi:MAG: hypothetical protein LV471_09255 [Nitrosomonas sp.]|nr:hypothetical protein [Nitrosomonas sp.]
MKNGSEITTTPCENGQIVQELYNVEMDVRKIIDRRVLDTRNEQIRNALIALGWTPPNGKL